eukprot:5626739-Amphidinium_carterae.2
MVFGKRNVKSSESGDNVREKKSAKNKTKLAAVPHYMRQCRSLLRSYPDESGSCVLTKPGMSLRAAFAPKNFKEKVQGDNAEVVNRPPYSPPHVQQVRTC